MTDGEEVRWEQKDTETRFAINYMVSSATAEDGTEFLALSLGLLPEGTEYADAVAQEDDPAMEGLTVLFSYARARRLFELLSEILS